MNIFAKLEVGIATNSAEETQALAVELAQALPAEAILGLHGNLGVGKTTFVQGLARGLGITESITSPTFTIFNIHRGAEGRSLIHLDAYRLTDAAQLDALMLEDFLNPPYYLAVEWPENIAAWLPSTTIHLYFSIQGEGRHHVQKK